MGFCRIANAKLVAMVLIFGTIIIGVVSVQLTLVLSAPSATVPGESSERNLRGNAPVAVEEDPEKARHDEIRDRLVGDFKERLERDAVNVKKSALTLDLERVERNVPDAGSSEKCLHALKLLQHRWPDQAQELLRQKIVEKKSLSGALAALSEMGLWGELLGGGADGFLEGEFFDVSCDYNNR